MNTTEMRERRARFRPSVGVAVPPTIVRLVMAAVMAGLCVAILGVGLLLAVGLFLAAATLVFPKIPAAWALAIILAVSALGPMHRAPDWRFFVVLAGAHALHLFGMTLGWLPISGRVQVRVFGPMLRSFLIIQVPAQLIAFFVLSLLAGASPSSTVTSPFFGLIAALGLIGLVVFVIAPLVRRDGDG